MWISTPIADYIEDDDQKCGFTNHYFRQKRNELYWELIAEILKERKQEDDENSKVKAKILADMLLDEMELELFKKSKESTESFLKALFLARSYKSWCQMIEREKYLKHYKMMRMKELFFLVLKSMLLLGSKPPTNEIKPEVNNLLPMPEIKGLTT